MTVRAEEPPRARWVVAGLTLFVIAAVVLTLYARPTAGGGAPTGLATVNAALNAGAAAALLAGFGFIRRRDVRAHRASMLTAFSLSSLFLVTYLLHHATAGSVPFRGTGWVRVLYFAILVPHVVLAAGIVPLALLTLYRGWTGRVESHRKIARWTLPLWLYVSGSGVAVYLMLYH